MRKLIQISAAAAPSIEGAHDAFVEAFALCDDGCIFNGVWVAEEFEWRQLPPNPTTRR